MITDHTRVDSTVMLEDENQNLIVLTTESIRKKPTLEKGNSFMQIDVTKHI